MIGDRVYSGRLDKDHVLRRFSEYVDELEDEAARGRQSGAASSGEGVGQDASSTYPSVARPELVSDYERRLYALLVDAGLRPIPQYSVEQYLLDFALFDGERKLAIEVDGEHYHRDWTGELMTRDRLRNIRLYELGWDVMRFWVYQIELEPEACVQKVRGWVSF